MIDKDVSPDELPVVILDVGTRCLTVWRRNDIRTVGQLTRMQATDLLDLRGFGELCLTQTVNALRKYGFELQPPDYRGRV